MVGAGGLHHPEPGVSSLASESSYRIEMQPPEGDAFYLTGEFREVDPPARLAYTFVWEDPDPDDVETVVELSFRDLGESTEVAFTQGPFKTEARRGFTGTAGRTASTSSSTSCPSEPEAGLGSRAAKRVPRPRRDWSMPPPAPSSRQALVKAMEALGLESSHRQTRQPRGGQHGTRL